MRINSRHFGELEIEDEKVISFPKGIIGFPQARAFALLNMPEIKPYQWLQGVDQPELAFLVVPAIIMRQDYQLNLSGQEAGLLKFKEAADPLVLLIVVLPDEPNEATVNLLAPIVINEPERLGGQIVNEQGGYHIRHLISEEMDKCAREGGENVGADAQAETVLDAGR